MKKLSRRLKKKHRLLLQRYDDKDLHQLRIILRRVRSRLKGLPGKKARSLHQDLGTLAKITNAARDWDTLVRRAEKTLPAEQFVHLLPLLEQYQRAAHDRVTCLLKSREWASAVERWQQYLDEDKREKFGTKDDSEQDLSLILKRLDAVRRKALAHDDKRHWHKLRIAIKDLRYRLDETPRDARTRRTREIITVCKELQEDLGEWHDSVIHTQLLRELSDSLDPDQPLVVDALEILRDIIAQRRREKLRRVKSTLQQTETLLDYRSLGA